MCFVTGAQCWEGMVARCPMCVDPGSLKPCWAPSAPPAASLTEKGNYLKPTYHTRKYSVLPLPALPQPPSDGQTCCWASPHIGARSSLSGLRLSGQPGLRDGGRQSSLAATGFLSFPTTSFRARHLLGWAPGRQVGGPTAASSVGCRASAGGDSLSLGVKHESQASSF